jgi:hypothetical protein
MIDSRGNSAICNGAALSQALLPATRLDGELNTERPHYPSKAKRHPKVAFCLATQA